MFFFNILNSKKNQLEQIFFKKNLKKKGGSRGNNTTGKTGIVISVSDELVICSGLNKAKFGELVKIKKEKKTFFGLVVNISWNTISCVFFTHTWVIEIGDVVRGTNCPMSIKITNTTIGTIIDILGDIQWVWYKFNKSKPKYQIIYKVQRSAPGIALRKGIHQPLHTGNILIDSLFPIGRGQRELILGDRQTGKTTVAINAIRTQRYDSLLHFFKQKLYCVYVAIGQKKANIIKLFYFLFKEDCLGHSVILAASASDPASVQFLAPYSGCSVAEFFRDRGFDSLIIYDDLSKQAVAYRQISLLLKRPPGREAYPGDIFYLHARLLERACKLSKKFLGGSLTALPIVETLDGDISTYIPTNIISITDGQIFLDREIFNELYRPAINIVLSVSRIGSKAQLKFYRGISRVFKNLLKYAILKSLSLSAGKKTDNHLKVLHVVNHRNSICIELQFFLLYLTVKGYFKKFNFNVVKFIIDNLRRLYDRNFNLKINLFKGMNLFIN